jgi:hypothetical protein
MVKVYNARQRKIYEDYSGLSTESLIEMVKSEKYIREVTDVVKDILIARNALPDDYKQVKLPPLVIKHEPENIEREINPDTPVNPEEVDFYIKQLEHNSDKDLAGIITKYTGYQLAAVEAALITAEKRGTITSDEKKKLLNQIGKGYNEYQKKETAITKEKISKSSLQIKTGLFLVVIGTSLTVWTLNNPFEGHYIVFSGFIISGLVLLYKGFFMVN